MPKYIVNVDMTIRRPISVHAANAEMARGKASEIVKSWKDVTDAKSVDALEL